MLFKGIPAARVAMIRHCGSVRSLLPGQLIFGEGDPAYGLFYVISGSVEIHRMGTSGAVALAELRAEECFGEMGLLSEARTRTASARAGANGAVVFEIGVDPVRLLADAGDHESALAIMQNLVGVLGRTLHRKDQEGGPRVHPRGGAGAALGETAGRALATIEASLPRGMWSRIFHHRVLKPGHVLCRAGDEPDGFHFIKSGLLHVHRGDGRDGDPIIAEVYAPALAGEVGFFSGQPRSATLVAATDVDSTHFTAGEFGKLRRDSPEDALRVLMAAAQLAACLIAQREEW